MPESQSPNGELPDRITFAYSFNSDMHNDLEDAASKLGISVSETISRAVDFELDKRAVRSGGMVLEGVAPNGVDSEPFYKLSTNKFSRDYDAEDLVRFDVEFDQEQMMAIMLLASYGYPETVEDKAESYQTWEEQRHIIGSTTAEALRNYFVRLQAEHNGWHLRLNPNMGDDFNLYLDRHAPAAQDGDATT